VFGFIRYDGLESVAMSETTTIAMLLAVFSLTAGTVPPFSKRLWERRDHIVTGVIDGIPISMSYRRMLFFHDYVAVWLSLDVVLLTAGVAFVFAAGTVEGDAARQTAYLFGSVALGGGAFNTILFPIWTSYIFSVLRQAEASHR
jgi:hypothetical protein